MNVVLKNQCVCGSKMVFKYSKQLLRSRKVGWLARISDFSWFLVRWGCSIWNFPNTVPKLRIFSLFHPAEHFSMIILPTGYSIWNFPNTAPDLDFSWLVSILLQQYPDGSGTVFGIFQILYPSQCHTGVASAGRKDPNCGKKKTWGVRSSVGFVPARHVGKIQIWEAELRCQPNFRKNKRRRTNARPMQDRVKYTVPSWTDIWWQGTVFGKFQILYLVGVKK